MAHKFLFVSERNANFNVSVRISQMFELQPKTSNFDGYVAMMPFFTFTVLVVSY